MKTEKEIVKNKAEVEDSLERYPDDEYMKGYRMALKWVLGEFDV